MALGERERRKLQEALVGTIGPDPADTLLGYLPPVGWADVATKRDLDYFANQLRLEITEMKSDLGMGISQLRTETALLRADMERALRRQLVTTLTIIVAMIAVVGTTGVLTR